MEQCLIITEMLTYSHTPNLEVLSHLKINFFLIHFEVSENQKKIVFFIAILVDQEGVGTKRPPPLLLGMHLRGYSWYC